MTFDCKILDIEGYALALSQTVVPYPTRMFLIANDTSELVNYMFISHRSNLEVDSKGGMFITYINDSGVIFTASAAFCNTGCSKCSEKVLAVCLVCKAGWYLFEGNCY